MKTARNRVAFPTILSLALAAAGVFGAAAPNAAASPAQADKRKGKAPDPGLYITFQTDKGDIACKLFEAEAPVTVRTMVGLAIGKISYLDPETQQVTRNKFFDRIDFTAWRPTF